VLPGGTAAITEVRGEGTHFPQLLSAYGAVSQWARDHRHRLLGPALEWRRGEEHLEVGWLIAEGVCRRAPARGTRKEGGDRGARGYSGGMTIQDSSQNALHVRPLAAVTGASSGIGRAIALELARRGYDLVVTAEDDELDGARAAAEALGAGVRAVRCDLRDATAVEAFYSAVTDDGRPLEVIALNAGVGRGGPFVENDLADELSIVDLNITSTIRLAKLVLPPMVKRDAGRVLVTSSIASEMPGSFQAVYNASKSFLQSFTEALQEELKDTGVTLTSLMPGPTDTEFFERAEMMDTKVGQAEKDDPAVVARQGVDALLSGKARVTGGGLRTRVQDIASKVMPDRLKAAMHRSMAEPGSGKQQ
jgi:short-subunit dehydrogenase